MLIACFAPGSGLGGHKRASRFGFARGRVRSWGRTERENTTRS